MMMMKKPYGDERQLGWNAKVGNRTVVAALWTNE